MREIEAPEKTQSITDELWKRARTMFQKQLAELYIDQSRIHPEHVTDGILPDQGTPHKPAVLYKSDGSLIHVKSEWTPEPFEDSAIPDMEFCILATEIIENSLKPKNPKPKK